MFRDVLSHANLTEWPILGLILFLMCSVGIIAWVFRKGSRSYYNEISNLVFEKSAEDAQTDSPQAGALRKEKQNGK